MGKGTFQVGGRAHAKALWQEGRWHAAGIEGQTEGPGGGNEGRVG